MSFSDDPHEMSCTISPPPPTEFYSRPNSHFHLPNQTSRHDKRSQLRRDDMKYVLDPLFREKTNLGTYVEGQSLVKPYKPRGPDGLPMRMPRQNPQVVHTFLEEGEDRYYQPAGFTMQDFILRLSETEHVPVEKVENVVLSKHTYKKLQKLLVQQCLQTNKTEMKTVTLKPSDDMPHVTPRIPQQQLLIEMAALVKEQMSGMMHSDMKSVIRPLPKYSPDYKPGVSRPHTEILLFENKDNEKQKQLSRYQQDTELPTRDNIFVGSAGGYFHGTRRSCSPFTPVVDGKLISPTELAILDSLMNGGTALSLKAHFISVLPDLEPLSSTITYLNLSFNDFRIIPLEVFDIEQLVVLKLRNNPITEIPPEISRLSNLRLLVLSFCLISVLPIELFKLSKLEHLDFAYNKVTMLPGDIRRLKNLRELNTEGNQLSAMPAGSLALKHLRYVRVRNNFMHPLFWKDNASNEPQRLADLAAMTVKQYHMENKHGSLPGHVTRFLNKHSRCDCCRGPLYGTGLKIIRPITKIYGIRNVPFLFHCCAPHCHAIMSGKSDSLVSMLYGVESGHKSE